MSISIPEVHLNDTTSAKNNIKVFGNAGADITAGDACSGEQINATEKQVKYTLSNIPVEIFLYICTFLDSQTIVTSLRSVCKRIDRILEDQDMWRLRIIRRWYINAYPAVPVDPETFDWCGACLKIEEENKKWTTSYDKLIQASWKEPHLSSIDSVLLFNSGNSCLTGSRDRNLVLWDLTHVEADSSVQAYVSINQQAHDGWIWQLVEHQNVIYSASWDSTVKSWDIDMEIQQKSVHRCPCSVLSLTSTPDVLAAGTYNRHVYLFDPRAGADPVDSYCIHTGSVLALAACSDFIVSASDDRTAGVWDIRAGRKFRDNIRLEDNEYGNRVFPRSLSFKDNVLYVGDNKGSVHLFNPLQGLFEYVKSFQIASEYTRVTSIYHNPGCWIAGLTDGTVNISTPTVERETLALLEPRIGEVTDLDYKGRTLAVAGTDCGLAVWMQPST